MAFQRTRRSWRTEQYWKTVVKRKRLGVAGGQENETQRRITLGTSHRKPQKKTKLDDRYQNEGLAHARTQSQKCRHQRTGTWTNTVTEV